MLKTHDNLGRSFPNRIVLIDDAFTVTDTDIWGTLEPLNIHGELYTPYLEAFASFYRDTGLYSGKRVSWLARSKNIRYLGEVAGPVVCRPLDQFPKERERISRNMTLRYDLTARGEAILKKAGRYHPIKHGGWRDHQVATACITASLHLAALNAGQRFYTPDEIAEDIGVKVPFEIEGREYENIRLVPDYLFGVDRYYAVETDLGNEVGRAEGPHRRKTYERMVLQYLELIGSGFYHKAYDIPASKALLMLFITTHKSKLDLMASIIKDKVGGCNFILMNHVPAEAFSAYHSPKPLLHLWTEPWSRANRPDFFVNNPARQ